MEVEVQGGSVDQALRVLKRRLMKDGLFHALKRHSHALSPGERRREKRVQAIKRRLRTAKRNARFFGKPNEEVR